jgi:hypothetical protein
MTTDRIMFIRHAEKPRVDVAIRLEADGTADPESLTVRGWQRAGALARFFCPVETMRCDSTEADGRIRGGNRSRQHE